MIKTKKEYQDALSAVKILETETMREDAQRLTASGLSTRTVELLLGASRARVTQLRDQIALYERVRAGDLSFFNGPEEFGRLLIGARIAKGWSQRELADRLKVHESQVSRDERNEYSGITLDRWRLLCQTLEIDIRTQARVAGFEKSLEEAKATLPLGPPGKVSVAFPQTNATHSTTLQPVRMSASLNPTEWLRGLANFGRVVGETLIPTWILHPNSGPTGATGPTGGSYAVL
jgi:transcriptional regulator with XRE-family HTH domain